MIEELSNRTFKLLIKWRDIIKQWQDEGGEQRAEELEYERRTARSFLRRSNRYDQPSGDMKSDNEYSEERNMDPSKRFRDNKRVSSQENIIVNL